MRAASTASFSRVSCAPRLPISPRVRSTIATRRPRAASTASVPPMTSSASSGCAHIPTTSKSATAVRTLAERALVEPLVLGDDAVGVEERRGPGAGGLAQAPAVLVVLQDLDRPRGHAFDVAHGKKESRLGVLHDLGQPSGVGSPDRPF